MPLTHKPCFLLNSGEGWQRLGRWPWESGTWQPCSEAWGRGGAVQRRHRRDTNSEQGGHPSSWPTRIREHETNPLRDFPGGPEGKTPCSQRRGPEFDPCSGNQIPHAATEGPPRGSEGIPCVPTETQLSQKKIEAPYFTVRETDASRKGAYVTALLAPRLKPKLWAGQLCDLERGPQPLCTSSPFLKNTSIPTLVRDVGELNNRSLPQ